MKLNEIAIAPDAILRTKNLIWDEPFLVLFWDDLIDNEKKIVIQVSSTNTKQKIESSLKKKLIEDYADYTFKFISISKEVENSPTISSSDIVLKSS